MSPYIFLVFNNCAFNRPYQLFVNMHVSPAFRCQANVLTTQMDPGVTARIKASCAPHVSQPHESHVLSGPPTLSAVDSVSHVGSRLPCCDNTSCGT